MLLGFPLSCSIFDLQKLNKLRELRSKGSEIIFLNYFETKRKCQFGIEKLSESY